VRIRPRPCSEEGRFVADPGGGHDGGQHDGSEGRPRASAAILKFESYALSFRGKIIGRRPMIETRNPVITVAGYRIRGSPALRFGAPE
jgi:hypothetical protein